MNAGTRILDGHVSELFLTALPFIFPSMVEKHIFFCQRTGEKEVRKVTGGRPWPEISLLKSRGNGHSREAKEPSVERDSGAHSPAPSPLTMWSHASDLWPQRSCFSARPRVGDCTHFTGLFEEIKEMKLLPPCLAE